VKALLRCTDEGRNWIRLDPDTDIALGLTRRPPTDDCLRGIAWWWTLASGRVRRIPAEHVGVVREGLEAVVGSLDGHPLAGTASRLAGLMREAERRGEPVRIETLAVAEFRRRASGRARLAGSSG
jgi:hypothetical protein